MCKVYVKWYGNVLEGELLDGEHLGFKQVRIPLDGHHPVALFSSRHVYQTEAEATACGLARTKPAQESMPVEVKEYVADVYAVTLLQRFKDSHWDAKRNHLRVDALEEFYQLWRSTHSHESAEARYIAGVDVADQKGDTNVVSTLNPPFPVYHKPLTKTTRITELALFD